MHGNAMSKVKTERDWIVIADVSEDIERRQRLQSDNHLASASRGDTPRLGQRRDSAINEDTLPKIADALHDFVVRCCCADRVQISDVDVIESKGMEVDVS